MFRLDPRLSRLTNSSHHPAARGGDAAKGAPRPALKLELLEPRLAMDGAGFVNTDPPEDPDSIVGVAGIVAEDDYVKAIPGTQTLRVSPLGNDQLPDGSTSLTIKSVSATRLGATVTVSEDGKHLLYNAAEGGLQSWDSFYYIVETEDGKLGKANVQIGVKHQRPGGGGGGHTPHRTSNDRYTVFEDASEQRFNVLANDRQLIDPTVVSISATSRGAVVRIADDGSAIFYTPPHGESGRDDFTYTARGTDGTEATYSVRVEIKKPYQIVGRYRDGDAARLDFGSGAVVLDPLANDRLLAPTELTPHIESFTAPDYAGTLEFAEEGKTFLYTPAEDYQGSFNIEYTVRYGSAEHQTVRGSFAVSVKPHFLAAPNWFAVDPSAEGPTEFDVLANDPLLQPFSDGRQAHYLPPATNGVSLKVVGVSAGSEGGTIQITGNGATVSYSPAAGFRGEETFTYTVEDSTGQRQTAEVTVYVADPISDPLQAGRFATERELQQFLIERAVEHYKSQFGQHVSRYEPGHYPIYRHQTWATDALNTVAFSTDAGASHSETNTQVAGVDEADIVETDGRYIYTFSGGQLAIVDLEDPSNPELISITDFDGRYDQMYLQGDRITLLRSGRSWRDNAEVLVLDLADRSAPELVERTEIDGQIVDSRAIGDRVHLVVHRQFDFPELGGEWVVEPTVLSLAAQSNEPGSWVLSTNGIWRNESLNEYLDRVRDQLFEAGLPTYKTYDATGELVASGLLTSPTDVHRPIAGDDLAVAMVTIDAGDQTPGPVADATTFVADNNATVYMSTNAAYVFSQNHRTDTTTIHKLALESDGTTPLVATGAIRGRLLNQFAADEHDGKLRIATTQQEREFSSNWRWRRQTRVFNNLLVLEQQGAELKRVGEITNLAPTETIHAIRYQGDRAFVVTFRRIDPLFAIDLSDPTKPTVEGALKIPGFSNYLHPVGGDYLIGIGRDADEITGRMGPLQITLFNVSDLTNPTVADQLTFEDANRVHSEAWLDHHAVSFFSTDNDEQGVLTLPISWTEQTESEGGYPTTTRHEALFTIDVSTEDGGSLESTGRIEHPAVNDAPIFSHYVSTIAIGNVWMPPVYQRLSKIHRAVQVGDALVTVSDRWVAIHELDDPEDRLGEVYLGPPAVRDSFTIEEDSGPQKLDVLANDFPLSGGEPPHIVAVTQPATGAAVAVAEDGQSLILTTEDNYFGDLSFSYTLEDPARGPVEAAVTIRVTNAPDAPMAIDDEITIEVNSEATQIDVLANDVDPDQGGYTFSYCILDDHWPLVLRSTPTESTHFPTFIAPFNPLKVIAVGATDQGGTVEIDPSGRLSYKPAEGFEGIETFVYTIENASGLTDVGMVTVVVGEPPVAASVTPETSDAPAIFVTLTPLDAPITVSAPTKRTAEADPAPQGFALLSLPEVKEVKEVVGQKQLAGPTQTAPASEAVIDDSLLLFSRHTDGVIDLAIDLLTASDHLEVRGPDETLKLTADLFAQLISEELIASL